MAVAVAVGMVLAISGAWRSGITLTGVALFVAGGLRAVLPDRMVGLLRVRRRGSDTVVMIGLGAALVVLALIVPVPDV